MGSDRTSPRLAVCCHTRPHGGRAAIVKCYGGGAVGVVEVVVGLRVVVEVFRLRILRGYACAGEVGVRGAERQAAGAAAAAWRCRIGSGGGCGGRPAGQEI